MHEQDVVLTLINVYDLAAVCENSFVKNYYSTFLYLFCLFVENC